MTTEYHPAFRTNLGTFTPLGARVFGARGRHTQTRRRSGEQSYETRGYDFIRNGVKLWFAAWGDRSGDWHIRDKVRRPPTQYELRRAKQVIFGLDRNGATEYRSHSGGLDV